jgi:uncharacterized protein DUF6209
MKQRRGIAMIERVHAGKPAQITFTRDFHELVIGDLRPGAAVDIRYDPQRIVPEGEPYLFGDLARPIIAHARFRDGDQAIDQPLESPAGAVIHPDTDVTGQGSMLSTSFSVPEDAQRVTLWFSYTTTAGDTRYESDYGANYCFGFPCRQIAVLSATVTGDPQASSSRFALSVAADIAVEEVAVRFYVVADPACAKHDARLRRTEKSDPLGRAVWSIGVPVPRQAVVRFKLFYRLGSHRFKDDNSGHYYLAPQPEPDRPPSPPAELAKAALAWT